MMEYANDVIREMIERRSCKSYTDKPVPQEMIDQVVECGLIRIMVRRSY